MMRATTSNLRNTTYLQILESVLHTRILYRGPDCMEQAAWNETGSGDEAALEAKKITARGEPGQAFGSLDSVVVLACSPEAGGLSFIPSFRARIPSPSPLPSSGSFFGPKTSRAMAKITSRCVGRNRLSSINTPCISIA